MVSAVPNTVPRHVAITMDGNGRWAAARGLIRSAGHKAGLDPVRMCIQECSRRKVSALTLFAFSSENWRRPVEEVTFLNHWSTPIAWLKNIVSTRFRRRHR